MQFVGTGDGAVGVAVAQQGVDFPRREEAQALQFVVSGRVEAERSGEPFLQGFEREGGGGLVVGFRKAFEDVFRQGFEERSRPGSGCRCGCRCRWGGVGCRCGYGCRWGGVGCRWPRFGGQQVGLTACRWLEDDQADGGGQTDKRVSAGDRRGGVDGGVACGAVGGMAGGMASCVASAAAYQAFHDTLICPVAPRGGW